MKKNFKEVMVTYLKNLKKYEKHKDNEVYITVHVRIKYGTNITAKTKELQKKIASGIKEMAAVTVKSVDVVVEAIDF